jgi:hypothetical protein
VRDPTFACRCLTAGPAACGNRRTSRSLDRVGRKRKSRSGRQPRGRVFVVCRHTASEGNMASVVEVFDENRTAVGSLTFIEAPEYLSAQRMGGGFELEFPMTVRLRLEKGSAPCPLLTDISALVTARNEAGNTLTLGRARHPGWLVGGIPESTVATSLIWSDTAQSLVAYERVRASKQPRFNFRVSAQLCYLVPSSGRRVRAEPQQVFGDVAVTYPTEVWLRMLRDLGVSQSLLLEVPLPSSPPNPWDAVWRAVGEATTAIERGGETGWKGCISAVRLALDRWREIEAEDMGPGWKRPDGDDVRKRTTRQRLDNIRWHIREYSHLAPHSDAEEFTRDDALLMLSALTALLAVRKP